MATDNDKKNVFQIGAESGVPFGIYLTGLSLSCIFADKVPFLSVITFVMLVAIPFIVFRSQRRQYLLSEGQANHSTLWMHGIMMNIGGAAICALLTWIIVHYVRPDFIAEQTRSALEIMKQEPTLKNSQMFEVLNSAAEKNFYPSLIDYCMQMFWLTSFVGALGSAFTAWLITKFFKKQS